MSEDITSVNIYQAVCAKKCPEISAADISFANGNVPTVSFPIMATTNFTQGINPLTGEAVATF